MDANTCAYNIAQIATGQKPNPRKSPSKVIAGKRGGLARAKALGKKKRTEIALKANRRRWAKAGDRT